MTISKIEEYEAGLLGGQGYFEVAWSPLASHPWYEVWPRCKAGRVKKVKANKIAAWVLGIVASLEDRMPSGTHIDHIDGNPLNFALNNLREATPSENLRNRRAYGKIPFRGVDMDRGKFRARFFIPGGGRKYLGHFDTPEEASAAHEECREEYDKTMED